MDKVDTQWGSFKVLSESPTYTVNELVINPKSTLIFHKHQFNNEDWYILKGQCSIITEFEKIQNTVIKRPNETYRIGKDVWHQAVNDTNNPCHILVVQFGEKCLEEDIERR